MQRLDPLKLENQLCFPLYACSKEIIKKYNPFLDVLDLTYTQYLVMMVLWEHHEVNVKLLGEKLFLDSGTLTPLLKKLENKGYIQRHRLPSDERNVMISITKEGKQLKEKAKDIPLKVSSCIRLKPEESTVLYQILYKVLGKMNE